MTRELPESARALRDALRRGEVTAREVTQRSLDRIDARRELGAFITVTADEALAQADAADTELAARRTGRSSGTSASHASRPEPTFRDLLGLPIAHKDLTDVAGAVTTHGSAALPHLLAAHDAPVPAILRDAGAISVGKTQVPEFGLTGYSENHIADPARNPLDLGRTAGGSSGGSAAAVAAGILPFAPGSDGGGSIRIPALACGIVGLKPGLGAIASDRADGETDAFGAPRLTVSGPLARTAEDAALLFNVMSGRSGTAHSTLEAVDRADDAAPLHIGVSTASPFAHALDIALTTEARTALDVAITRLGHRGHRVEDLDVTYATDYAEVFDVVWTSGLSLIDLAPGAEDILMPLTRTFRERALARSDETKRAAGDRMQQIAADMRDQWARADIVLTPGLAMLPPPIGAFTSLDADADFALQCQWAPYTSMVNVSGLPAIAVPIVTLPSGLSMGVQLIGKMGDEARLLQLAAQLLDS